MKRAIRPVTLFLFRLTFWFAHQDELVFGEDEEVEDVEDTGRVNQKEREEPVAIVVSRGFPEGHTLPDK